MKSSKALGLKSPDFFFFEWGRMALCQSRICVLFSALLLLTCRILATLLHFCLDSHFMLGNNNNNIGWCFCINHGSESKQLDLKLLVGKLVRCWMLIEHVMFLAIRMLFNEGLKCFLVFASDIRRQELAGSQLG